MQNNNLKNTKSGISSNSVIVNKEENSYIRVGGNGKDEEKQGRKNNPIQNKKRKISDFFSCNENVESNNHNLREENLQSPQLQKKQKKEPRNIDGK